MASIMILISYRILAVYNAPGKGCLQMSARWPCTMQKVTVDLEQQACSALLSCTSIGRPRERHMHGGLQLAGL